MWGKVKQVDETLGWHLGKRGGDACWERPAAHAACPPGQDKDLCEGGRDEKNLIGRREARFHRGLSPTQNGLGCIQYAGGSSWSL